MDAEVDAGNSNTTKKITEETQTPPAKKPRDQHCPQAFWNSSTIAIFFFMLIVPCNVYNTRTCLQRGRELLLDTNSLPRNSPWNQPRWLLQFSSTLSHSPAHLTSLLPVGMWVSTLQTLLQNMFEIRSSCGGCLFRGEPTLGYCDSGFSSSRSPSKSCECNFWGQTHTGCWRVCSLWADGWWYWVILGFLRSVFGKVSQKRTRRKPNMDARWLKATCKLVVDFSQTGGVQAAATCMLDGMDYTFSSNIRGLPICNEAEQMGFWNRKIF